ncbi:MAG: arginine N-succinyltransferase [Proteobacteria bacterium]|nr:arginine N-succinyltransferase [Pseudomonadota bacterium]
MMLVRPVKPKDLNGILELAQQSSGGMTTLPPNKKLIQTKIQNSIQAFSKPADQHSSALYFFVLEDLEKKKIAGTCAIDSRVGLEVPFYSYHVGTLTKINYDLDITSRYQILHLNNDFSGKSEICTLFLAQPYRKGGLGLLLSRSRFLFMAQFPTRFSDIIFAEMRGFSDKNGQSPFWEGLGKHFFQMEFTRADQLTGTTDKQFIADLMPNLPVYVPLLPKQAQQVIGQVHENTRPALKILQKEGFRFSGYVDIFDGGPLIDTPLTEIRTVSESRLSEVGSMRTELMSERYLIANASLDNFRVCFGSLEQELDGSVTITPEVAKALQIKVGDQIRWVLF